MSTCGLPTDAVLPLLPGGARFHISLRAGRGYKDSTHSVWALLAAKCRQCFALADAGWGAILVWKTRRDADGLA